MKKWQILILLILMMSTVEAGFFIPSNGGASSSGGLISSVRNFFTSQPIISGPLVCSPIPRFTQDSVCTGGQNPSQNLSTYDADWVSCCQLGGGCYLNDTSAQNATYFLQDAPCGEIPMELVAIAIILVGVMFWVIKVANDIEIRNEDDKVVPLNAMFVMILWTTGAFIAFFAIQTALGIALDNNIGDQALASIKGVQQFVSAIGTIVMFLLFFGVFINAGWAAIEFVQKRFFDRGPPNRRRRN